MPSRNIVLTLSLVISAPLRAEGTILFVKDIQPILESIFLLEVPWQRYSTVQARSSFARGRAGWRYPTAGDLPRKSGRKQAVPYDRRAGQANHADGWRAAAEQVQKIRRIKKAGNGIAPPRLSPPKTTAADLEGGSLPPGARQYWAFQVPVRKPVPVVADGTDESSSGRCVSDAEAAGAWH